MAGATMVAQAGRLAVMDVPAAQPAARSASTVLPPTAETVPLARRFARATLGQWDLEEYDESASLLVSELVTNAVLHARTEVTLSIVDHGDRVVLSVGDGSPVLPVQRRHSREAATGRGLLLLDRYATGYGVARSAAGKQVWAVLRPGAMTFDDDALADWFEGVEAL
jgi:anti-sigma regulatory factor (Ser/Thr protein kinase)